MVRIPLMTMVTRTMVVIVIVIMTVIATAASIIDSYIQAGDNDVDGQPAM